jgi:DNA-binding response OmpR family regulator
MGNKKVLVIEDDRDVRLGYHVLLKAHGYDTYFVEDGFDAIGEAHMEHPDVIILDLGLPRVDGFVVLEKLRANKYLTVIPVIVISGRDIQSSKERALKAGATAFLQKPWDDKELLSLIGQLAEQSASIS